MHTIEPKDFPHLLKHIPKPPKQLHVQGVLPKEDAKILCIVGARHHTEYGEQVCKNIIQGLRGYNICIVSGLALGIDTIAHKTALEVGLQTIAFPGSGLHPSVIYPQRHRFIAEEIVEHGGALISEFPLMQQGARWTFPQRNRLMAGISHAVIVIEAELQSGTLITSRCAVDYNRDVGAVPGDIFSSLSEGPHMLIRLGATPITCSEDVLEMLGIQPKEDGF